MTDKELRKLSRTELLKLLIEVTEENERLTEENESLRAGGATILVDEKGRPASSKENPDFKDVPSARLEEIFRSAEYAAGKFLKEAQDIADGIIAEAEERAGVPAEERTSASGAAYPAAGAGSPSGAQLTQMQQTQSVAQPYMASSYGMQQGMMYNAYGSGGYYQTGNYTQPGYGMQYQPGQFYLYQPGMFQQGAAQQQAAPLNSYETQEVNASFENTPEGEGKAAEQVTTAENASIDAEAAHAAELKVQEVQSVETAQKEAAPAKPKRQPTAMELLQGNIEPDEEETDDGFEVELVSIFPDASEDGPQMTLQEELASKRDPSQPMSALERLMIATRRDKEQAEKEERVNKAREAQKVELQRNPYEHKPKGFPVPAKAAAQEETVKDADPDGSKPEETKETEATKET